MSFSTLLIVVLSYFGIGLIVMVWSACEVANEFCQVKIQSPAAQVQIQFANLWFQALAWPAVLAVKFVQWQYSDRIKSAIADFNVKEQR